MATTTNYGWTTPDNTALVKDGASAIRTLGSSIDTTLKAQIDAQIPDTLLTTTGDTIYASAANTPARLGIGTTGQVLIVSGGLPAWGTPAAGSLTLLSTTTLSGASITISSINQSYKDLYVLVHGINLASDNTGRVAPNGSTTTTRGITTYQSSIQLDSGYIFLDDNVQGTKAGDTNNATVFVINNYSSATTFKPFDNYGICYAGTNAYRAFSRSGGIYSSSAITSLVFSTTGGVNYNGGTVLIYGVN